MNINFRNVFNEATKFSFQVDHCLFKLTKPENTIQPHKDYSINVSFDQPDDTNYDIITGKLFVFRIPNPEQPPCYWVYYLRGIPPPPPPPPSSAEEEEKIGKASGKDAKKDKDEKKWKAAGKK